jgi:hypothetical protein
MNTDKEKRTKPASENPVREARGHPNGPSLTEMLNRQEEKKLSPEKNSKKPSSNPDIPII